MHRLIIIVIINAQRIQLFWDVNYWPTLYKLAASLYNRIEHIATRQHQGDHSFRKIIFLDFSKTFQDQPNWISMTYQHYVFPELVGTVPAGCSSTAKDDNQWKLSTHSLLTFTTEFLSAVVKISWLFHGFSMTFAVFHD